MSVVVEQMRPKLLDLEQVTQLLQQTEPMTASMLTSDSKIKFKLGAEWATTLDAIPGTFPVDAYMSVEGVERQLTKDAALQAGALFGYTAALMKRSPAFLTEQNLNYWYSGGYGDSEHKMLTVGENIAAFVKPTITPFSNLELLDRALSGIRKQYGEGVEVLADYKISNTIQQTDIRLIIPEKSRVIVNGNELDVPQDETDMWSAGVHLSNSLLGKTQTALEAYLFRWWCTNGATTALESAGTWSRRAGEEMDVYAWAEQAVEEVLGGLEHRFDQVQALTTLGVGSNTADVVRRIFNDYDVPKSQRGAITEHLVAAAGHADLTMYNIMNSITLTANEEGLAPARQDKLMRLGGDIPEAMFDTEKAKVWNEGHTADPEAENPYAIKPLVA